jgi:hypothetical protein
MRRAFVLFESVSLGLLSDSSLLVLEVRLFFVSFLMLVFFGFNLASLSVELLVASSASLLDEDDDSASLWLLLVLLAA